MACEIPLGIIRELQTSLRNSAHISSYDPTDGSLPDLPSGEDSIPRLDPSPPHLRCNHCKGRLLRGISSPVCVFCGWEQWIEAPPDPINFRSTTGYKWLLESLQLDELEVVELYSEAKEAGRLRKVPKEVPLSDILNLEIRWRSHSEQPETPEDISKQMEMAFGPGKESDGWFQGDPRSNSVVGTTIGSSDETIRTIRETDDAERLMSQMHDLSFMLNESNLSISNVSQD